MRSKSKRKLKSCIAPCARYLNGPQKIWIFRYGIIVYGWRLPISPICLYALRMHSYAALLGHNPGLSIAEISALTPDITKEHVFPGSFLTFSTAETIDQAALKRLGGTLLIAKKITGDAVVNLQDLPSVLAAELAPVKGKVVFALRFVGIPPREGHDLLRTCKKNLKQRGIPSRYVGSEREPAKPIQLHDEGLLDPKRGCELTILREKDRLWIGRTIAAQDVKGYTERDIGKPVRDMTIGILPPKLAQILLNFGEYLLQKNSNLKPRTSKLIVYDPFCGTGVIPIEALMRGNTVLASDVSLKAVNGCEKNLEWARKTYKILKKDTESTVWKQDATKPFDLGKNVPDMIVTEGTLGPTLKERATVKDIEKYVRDSDNLTEAFLKNCAACLPTTPIVMTLPVWYAQKKMVTLKRIAATIDECGYRSVLPPHVDSWQPDRLSILYRRNDQFVGREIVLLKPKNK